MANIEATAGMFVSNKMKLFFHKNETSMPAVLGEIPTADDTTIFDGGTFVTGGALEYTSDTSTTELRSAGDGDYGVKRSIVTEIMDQLVGNFTQYNELTNFLRWGEVQPDGARANPPTKDNSIHKITAVLTDDAMEIVQILEGLVKVQSVDAASWQEADATTTPTTFTFVKGAPRMTEIDLSTSV